MAGSLRYADVVLSFVLPAIAKQKKIKRISYDAAG